MQNNKENTAVIVMSCDRYHDLWDPFFHFFEKYWPDCPYPVYLATNSKIYKRKNVLQLFSNNTSTWSDETLETLKQLPCDYLIYLQDDYFLTQPVNNVEIHRLLDKMVQHNAAYLRLFPSPGPDEIFQPDLELGVIGKTAGYRTSLQSAIWSKAVFMNLLVKTENQWQFETQAGKRSGDFVFLSVKQKSKNIKSDVYPISYYYLTAVLRGKWRREAVKLCRQDGLHLDTGYRPVESILTTFYQQCYQSAPNIIKKMCDFIIYKFKPVNKEV